eukprot:TRINITY_DN43880_c0_g1_i1.p1 TRINITY_DN43880_c0_g1~~TRINITY_DN43880_c0_g1_i1.p1  ORF type:complete len:808 (-),score=158.80 TRINITY_DN43880_c0_g1_i1:102-2525(-)
MKVAIRPLKRVPRPPADFEERSWAVLQSAVRAIYAKEPVLPFSGSQEELYRLVQALCLNGSEAKLTRLLRQECDEHISAKLASLRVAACGTAPPTGAAAAADSLLPLVQAVWQDHCDATGRLCAVFTFLDRTYLLSRRDSVVVDTCLAPALAPFGDAGVTGASGADAARSLRDCCVRLFRCKLDMLPEVRNRVLQGVVSLVDADRGLATNVVATSTAAVDADEQPRLKTAPRILLSSLVTMFVSVDLYAPLLEPALLEATAEFYRVECNKLLPTVPVSEYLEHCERRLDEEQQRCEACLVHSSAVGILSAAREELLKRPSAQVLDKGFSSLVEGHKVRDLLRLFRLFAQVDELPSVRRAWAHAIREMGASIMAKAEDCEEAKTVVPAWILLHERLSEIHQASFMMSADFGIALKDAFEGFLNAGPQQNLPAKLLARHFDDVMRNEKASSDEEIERAVDRALGVFRFLSAKDAFEAFYKKDLSKRLLLLNSTAASVDAEALMVLKLRDECGGGYTSKLEGMFRDVELSKSLLTEFRTRPEVRSMLEDASTVASAVASPVGIASVAIDFSFSVITTGLWPTQPPSPEIAYPLGPARLQDSFSKFYTERFTGRSLRWSPLLGQCTLRASYEGGARKELVVSVFQALVCLAFNTKASLTCVELASVTKIPQVDLHRTLQSLALHKYVKILLKNPKSREVAEDDIFSVNFSFSSYKLHRVVVPQISTKEQLEEETAVERRVFDDRQHEVDAAVVRIMKVKKRLTHQHLVAEVFAALSFPILASDIKTRIGSLLEREYLERDPKDVATYSYMA